jgi:hypothetical protein
MDVSYTTLSKGMNKTNKQYMFFLDLWLLVFVWFVGVSRSQNHLRDTTPNVNLHTKDQFLY